MFDFNESTSFPFLPLSSSKCGSADRPIYFLRYAVPFAGPARSRAFFNELRARIPASASQDVRENARDEFGDIVPGVFVVACVGDAARDHAIEQVSCAESAMRPGSGCMF